MRMNEERLPQAGLSYDSPGENVRLPFRLRDIKDILIAWLVRAQVPEQPQRLYIGSWCMALDKSTFVDVFMPLSRKAVPRRLLHRCHHDAILWVRCRSRFSNLQ